MENDTLAKKTYRDIVSEAQRARVEGVYKPPKQPQQRRRWYALKSGLLVGTLTSCAMYFGALHGEGLKGAASSAVGKIEHALFSSQNAFSGFIRDALQLEPKSIDNKLSDEERKVVINFFRKMESSGFSLENIIPYLKPEAAEKIQAFYKTYKQEAGENDTNNYGR